MPRTKIICTVGPASDSVSVLVDMIRAGMNVTRLNFSHGTWEEHANRFALIKEAQKISGLNLAIMLDTKGPEIRLGYLKGGAVELTKGERVVLTGRNIIGDKETLPITYQELSEHVKASDLIYISDGLIELKVLGIVENGVNCEIVHGGKISSQKNVVLPNVRIYFPSITPQDEKDIVFGIKQGIDFIAASFVRNASDVLAIRRLLENSGSRADIIAKIESREGLDNLDEIIKVADGIMVARGDLGVVIPVEDVPLVQKMIIDKCNKAGKPVITATQMLESMISNPKPTRAEASDVANAILDGSDGIMLSGETASGNYPLKAVQMMARIAEKTETSLNFGRGKTDYSSLNWTVTDSISHGTCTIAEELGASAIITSTQTGYTSKMVSKYRPKVPVLAVTPDELVLKKMAIVWGVEPLLVRKSKDTDSMISAALEASLHAGLVSIGDLVVITSGVPSGTYGTTNLIKVQIVE
ncbi:MAG: pyruvate kinase [Peptococcaceae bacterium]|nr:pyruvate kinase [Peptococcaceae bacterium]